MKGLEQEDDIDQWCIIANGGCSPIALQIAERSVGGLTLKGNVSNIILSSVPRLPFFLQRSNDPLKVQRSYRTLCGLPGNLFWWYACRDNGSFIQKFSEKNLVADPDSLDESWRQNCYETATANGGKSRFSTFAFLAGTLQDGCFVSLQALNGKDVVIDIIKGGDVRRNRARSWFWQKRRRRRKNTSLDSNSKKNREPFRDYVEKNGNGGKVAAVGGRISLAHEDSDGYARAVIDFLNK
jgi:hypothetical protein